MSRVAILVFDGVQILDSTGPAAAFEIAGFYGAPYSITLVAPSKRVVSSCGIPLEATLLEEAEFDTLIVAGAETAWKMTWSPEVVEFVAEAVRSSRRVASVCAGSFLLAEAGVLDGRRAATHWAAVTMLKRRYPAISVDPESIYVEDRGVWSSAGVTAGIDLALAMIARDHGDELARKVAQRMVVYYRRPGTQSQHSALLELVTPDNRFGPLLSWARAHLAEPLDVERLAEQSALSVRQFTRAFTKATGMPPAKAIERLRVEEARSMIEAGAPSLEVVARRTGFGSGERMRRAFLKITGQPPQALRRASEPREDQHMLEA